jgi:hypothetical protein
VLVVAEDHFGLGELPATLDEDCSGTVDQNLGNVVFAKQSPDGTITEELIHHRADGNVSFVVVERTEAVVGLFIHKLVETNPQLLFREMLGNLRAHGPQKPVVQGWRLSGLLPVDLRHRLEAGMGQNGAEWIELSGDRGGSGISESNR